MNLVPPAQRLVLPPRRVLVRILALMALGVGTARGEAEDGVAARLGSEFESSIRAVLEEHCVACHGAAIHEGGVDLEAIEEGATAVRKRKLWRRAAARVEAGEMPPDGEEPLAEGDRRRLVEWMRRTAAAEDTTPRALRDPGPAPLRRLTRREYDRTIAVLLGIPFNSAQAVGLPQDGGDGFENLAVALDLSAARIDKYFEAADLALEALFSSDGRAQRARKQLFFQEPSETVSERDAAERVLGRFARRAYRRPPSDEQIERLMSVYDQARSRGEGHEEAVRKALKPALVSPYFLLRIEQDRPAEGEAPGVPVDDHELAVRLSYFLWSMMPDEELFRLADEGRLSDPEVLKAQVRRMLKDGKARELTDGFAVAWLQMKKLNQARPSQEFFPTFNGNLKNAMRNEVIRFFEAIRQEDRSILDLLDADYTFVNEALAKHYGIKGVSGGQMQQVKLSPEQHRGGILGMSGVLAMTSHSYRTSPTQRGKYVLEVIFGTPPPPPPPNVGTLKDDKPAKDAPQSFREKLAQHASVASCAGCHAKIDPLGFALENYDAIGAWREATADQPLDVGGVLPNGEKVPDVEALKRIILSRKDDFARNVCEQMLTYALGRTLDDEDESTVNEMVAHLQRSDYRFSALIDSVVQSVPFRLRRAAETKP